MVLLRFFRGQRLNHGHSEGLLRGRQGVVVVEVEAEGKEAQDIVRLVALTQYSSFQLFIVPTFIPAPSIEPSANQTASHTPPQHHPIDE